MAAFEERWGESPALQVLRILGLFDRPAEVAAVAAVRRPPAIAGLADQLQNLTEREWLEVLENLRQHNLVAPRSRHNLDTLDCHPLVREHFGEKLKTDSATAWKEAHSRLYEYYKAVPKKEFPDTLEEMEPLYAAVVHGCRAGRYQEAMEEIYWLRVLRSNEHYSWKKLGSFGSDLAAISGFFEDAWHQTVTPLADDYKGLALNQAGLYLHALGRLVEAAQPLKASLDAAISRQDWKNSSISASNISDLYLTLGDLTQALHYAEQCIALADRSGGWSIRMMMRTTLADVLHQMGRLEEAADSFHEAEQMQKEDQPEYPLLYALQGYKYCDLLLDQCQMQEVLRRVNQTLKWVVQAQWLLDIALDHLSFGRGHLQQVRHHQSRDSTTAETHLNQAVAGLRQAGDQEFVARGLLSRAELHRATEDFAKAQRDLDEAFKIATRGGMRLHEADCHLEYARLHLAMDEKDKARESWAKAKKMIEEMGYHRRDPEIHLIEAQLHLTSGEKDKARGSLAKAKELIDKMGMHRWDLEVEELEKLVSE